MVHQKKRIDYLTAEHAKVPAATFVGAVNDCYYRRNAGKYDATPDIVHDAVLAWRRMAGFFKGMSGIDNYTVVDIGAGTGFVAERFASGWLPAAKYIGFEPSDDMRKIAQNKHNDSRISFRPMNVSLKTSEIIASVVGPKIITMNSVLHHIVWWEDFLDDLVACLNPGDLLVLCHEPNSRFWENKWMVTTFDELVKERKKPRSLLKYLNPHNYVRKLQRLFGDGQKVGNSLTNLINKELRANGIISKDLHPDMVGAIIDYSVPLCWRNIEFDKSFDEGFFNIECLEKNFLQGCDLFHSFTYQHLAFSPILLKDKWKRFEADIAKECPDDGAQFCLIARKKQ